MKGIIKSITYYILCLEILFMLPFFSYAADIATPSDASRLMLMGSTKSDNIVEESASLYSTVDANSDGEPDYSYVNGLKFYHVTDTNSSTDNTISEILPAQFEKSYFFDQYIEYVVDSERNSYKYTNFFVNNNELPFNWEYDEFNHGYEDLPLIFFASCNSNVNNGSSSRSFYFGYAYSNLGIATLISDVAKSLYEPGENLNRIYGSSFIVTNQGRIGFLFPDADQSGNQSVYMYNYKLFPSLLTYNVNGTEPIGPDPDGPSSGSVDLTETNSLIEKAYKGLLQIEYTLTKSNISSTTNNPVQVNFHDQDIDIYRFPIKHTKISFDQSTGFGIDRSTTYGTFADLINSFWNDLVISIRQFGMYIFRYGDYGMYNFQRSQNGESYNLTIETEKANFNDVIRNRLNTIVQLLDYFCSRFFEWYYPLDNVIPEYWKYYNTDTKQSEDIGLAGLMYNISWYLGQLYALQSENAELSNMNDAIQDVNQQFQQVEQAEHQVFESVNSSIESFIPSFDDFASFRALSWASEYLQQVWVSLGLYGTIIQIALILGVCMQFIGYFRYKG